MSKKTYIHAAIMLFLSLVIVYLIMSLTTQPGSNSSYNIGHLIGRASSTTLFPLAVAAIPAGIYKLIKKSPMPGFYILWWVLWFLYAGLGAIGSLT